MGKGVVERGIAAGVNGLQKIADIGTTAGELAASKKTFITKSIINGVLLVVILIVFGCFDWMNFKFHFDYLADPNFWGKTTMKVVSAICAYNIGINFIVDEVIRKNKNLGTAKFRYEVLNASKQRDFEYYIHHVYNPSEKKKVYINQINRKIHLLNRFSRRKDRILYVSTLEEKQPLKLTNRYCIKRKELEYLKSDEYIEKNIENLNVRYKDIDHTIFELEINGKTKIKQNAVSGSVAKGQAISSGTGILSIVGATMFISSFSVAPNQEEFVEGTVAAVNTVVKMCSDIFVIIWQFFRGILSATNIVSQQLTTPYVTRVEILKSYYKWRQEKGETVPQFYLTLYKMDNVAVETDEEESNEKEIEIEMTPEEYQEYLNNQKEKEVE